MVDRVVIETTRLLDVLRRPNRVIVKLSSLGVFSDGLTTVTRHVDHVIVQMKLNLMCKRRVLFSDVGKRKFVHGCPVSAVGSSVRIAGFQ